MEHVMVELCVRVLLMHLSCAFGCVLGYGLCLWFRVMLHLVLDVQEDGLSLDYVCVMSLGASCFLFGYVFCLRCRGIMWTARGTDRLHLLGYSLHTYLEWSGVLR